MDPLDALLRHKWVAPLVARVPQSFPLLQVLRFAFVGGFVTLLHVAVALSVHGLFAVPALWANLIAFIAAFAVSYFLNWLWTFDAVSRHGAALPKFLAVSLSGFGVNQAIVYLVAVRAGYPMWVAMIPVTVIIPVFSFIMSKTWVFLADRHA